MVSRKCSQSFRPELPRNSDRIKVDRFPAFGFVATAIDDTMVGAAKETANSSLTLRPRVRDCVNRG